MVEQLKQLIKNQEGIGDILIGLQNKEEFLEENIRYCEGCSGELRETMIGDEVYDKCRVCGLVQ